MPHGASRTPACSCRRCGGFSRTPPSVAASFCAFAAHWPYRPGGFALRGREGEPGTGKAVGSPQQGDDAEDGGGQSPSASEVQAVDEGNQVLLPWLMSPHCARLNPAAVRIDKHLIIGGFG
jgi:hypothetical protein